PGRRGWSAGLNRAVYASLTPRAGPRCADLCTGPERLPVCTPRASVLPRCLNETLIPSAGLGGDPRNPHGRDDRMGTSGQAGENRRTVKGSSRFSTRLTGPIDPTPTLYKT